MQKVRATIPHSSHENIDRVQRKDCSALSMNNAAAADLAHESLSNQRQNWIGHD